jgi:uncharacterized membrane protein HdeD (DUF308 family)
VTRNEWRRERNINRAQRDAEVAEDVAAGVGEFAMAFTSGGTAGSRFMFGLTGLIAVALGVVLVVRPDVGAVALAQVFGLFSFAYGIANLILAASVHESTAAQGATA